MAAVLALAKLAVPVAAVAGTATPAFRAIGRGAGKAVERRHLFRGLDFIAQQVKGLQHLRRIRVSIFNRFQFSHCHFVLRVGSQPANNSFKPSPLRGLVVSDVRRQRAGLTQALGR